MKRYLITTADERTWQFDRPVLFLGEWCRLYSRTPVWAGVDGLVAAPFGLRPGQKERDIAYVQALSKQLLKELTSALNAFHGTTHGVRYWNILLGHWLQRYVSLVFNRFFTLEQALENHEISGTTVLDFADYSLAVMDSDAFVWVSNDDLWNHVLYARVLEFLGGVKIESRSIHLEGVRCFKQEGNATGTQSTAAKRVVSAIVSHILPKLSRRGDAFIVSSYLPKMEEAKLSLTLGQCPQLWRSPKLTNAVLDPARRRHFCVDAERHLGFERFVRRQLGDMVPICYLEGYQQLCLQAESVSWPTTPRFILTSNRFDTDEVFKAWTSRQVEQGTRYFIGQHGNNYGTLLGSSDFPELVTCDKFFTWGWTNGNPKNIPAFVFTIVGRKLQYAVSEGDLLLIELPPPHRHGPEDAYYEYGIYQEQQFRFVKALPEGIQAKLMVRLHSGFRRFSWSAEERWAERYPQVRIERGATPIQTLIRRSRLVVHSYDSTGILETLALNIPTLCFWHGGLDHLLSSAKPYYALLRNAGILIDTPAHAATLVTERWESIEQWWGSERVQNARKAFCAEYAQTEKHPIRTLKRLLTKDN